MTYTAIEPFVRNAWYIAAWPEELTGGTIVARVIMNQPLVVFRGPDGRAAALEDRCCHRGAPLSRGQIVGNGLQCGYHGLVFDGSGSCVEIPGEDGVTNNAAVRAYPVVERHQCIWIWMGDPTRADETKIVDYPTHDQPDQWPHIKEMFPIKANYMMMIDNLMDLTHLAYVHQKTIGGSPQAHAAAELAVEATPSGCHYDRWMMNSPAPPTYRKAAGLTDRVDRWHDFEYVGPATVLQKTGAIDAGKGARENRDQPGFHVRVFHHATPETETSFHYFWSVAAGFRQNDPATVKNFYADAYPTFLEDKEIMEIQQQRIDLDPDRELVAIKADKALYFARQALHKLIDIDQAMGAAAD